MVKSASTIIASEKGAALVTALLVLVILTIMGTAAMMVRNTEQSIVLNSEVFQHNFYSLEGVTLEGAHAVDNLDDECLLNFSSSKCPPTYYPPGFPTNITDMNWIQPFNPNPLAITDMTQQSNWPSGSISPVASSLNTDPTNIIPPGYNDTGTAADDRIWYSAIDRGICKGGSYKEGEPQEKCYDVYGMYDTKRGAGKSYSGHMMLLVGYQQVVYPPAP